ncbi:MAG: ParB/RepB/Spo0J family partition protein [Synergistaceae bacterium]|nr:ParB/RepB/Spo0J family partition protein [Synergistaceae bacterium]
MAEYTMIPVERIFPHPDNPRKDLGDLSELSESIKASGILQNLTVVPGRRGTDEEIEQIKELLGTLTGDSEIERNAIKEIQAQIDNKWVADDYTAIIGHRRLAAAKLAGLTEVPCVVASLTPQEQVQTMLMENMQRSDLTAYEQAQGFQMMIDLGDTVEVVAQKTGFSETTIRRRLKMAELDQAKLKEVSSRQLSLGDFDKLAQIEDIKARNKVLDSIGTSEFNMRFTSAIRDQNTKKNLPVVKKWLKEAGAKKVEQKDTWGSKYENYPGTSWSMSISDWGDVNNKPPKVTKRQMFYYIDGDRVRLLAEKEKAPREKKSPEELALARSRSAAWKEANEKTDLAFTLRKNFVDTLNGTKKNTDLMLWGALAGIALNATYNDMDKDRIQTALGLQTGWFSDKDNKIIAAYRDADLKIAPQLVYAAFGDDAKRGYVAGYPSQEFPRYQENRKLDLLYDWLISLGYELSEEEKQMRDGTHEVFKRGEA